MLWWQAVWHSWGSDFLEFMVERNEPGDLCADSTFLDAPFNQSRL